MQRKKLRGYTFYYKLKSALKRWPFIYELRFKVIFRKIGNFDDIKNGAKENSLNPNSIRIFCNQANINIIGYTISCLALLT